MSETKGYWTKGRKALFLILLLAGSGIGFTVLAVISPTIDNTKAEFTNMKAETMNVTSTLYVNGNQYYPNEDYSYTVWVSAGTYYAKNGATGAVTSSATFSTLMNTLTTALAASGGGIFLKSGAYTLTAEIRSTGPLTVRGEDRDTTIITVSGDVEVWDHTTGATDYALHMSDFTLNCARGTGGQTEGGTKQGIQVHNSGYFNNLKILNTAQSPIVAVAGEGTNPSDPITDFYVTNCVFNNTGSTAGANPHKGSLRTDGGPVWGNAGSIPIKHAVITGNYFTNCNEHGMKSYSESCESVYVAGNYWDTVYGGTINMECNSTIVGNYITNVGSASGGAAIYLSWGGHHVVDGNIINSTLLACNGIQTSWDDGGTTMPPLSAIITNNVVLNSAAYGIMIQSDLEDTIISNNRVIDSANVGIRVGDDCDRTQIKDNVVKLTVVDKAAIQIADSDYCVISGNWISSHYGIHENGADYTLIHDNDLNTSHPLSASLATNSQIYNNRGINQSMNPILTSTLSSDHTASGMILKGFVGENVTFGMLVYLKSDGKFWKTDANAEATTKGLVCMALGTLATTDATEGNLLLYGVARDDTWAWTVGSPLFISESAGEFVHTAPADAGDFVRQVAVGGITGDYLYFNGMNLDWGEL